MFVYYIKKMPFYASEYKHGSEEEAKVLPVIRDYFQRDIERFSKKFSKHDFQCPDYTYELKSRRVKRDTFPDTIIGYNKVQELSKPLVLLYNFTDYLCYCEYDPVIFEDYKKELFGRLDRPTNEAKIHIHIPIDSLTTICKW